MTSWETIRHPIAISGRVSNARTGKPCPAAQVEITSAPAEFTAWLALKALPYGDRWPDLPQRPDRIRTAVDGHFHFLDLPNGDYTLTASIPQQGSRYGTAQTTVTVSRSADRIVAVTADLALSPTTLQGRITNASAEAVSFAEIRIRGSGERSFSNRSGDYQLLQLEASTQIDRTVIVSASGYQSVTQTIAIDQPGVVRTLDIVLNP
ncbi:MAG: carboxypeptidase regulatory-like domain-containing protein [Cyanobacteria bacterium SID2]|nr:carboxypeptidase regulatory-like domain-containing protein [Cyanobacteria bacterium SID2]MBP0003257.1 carboxypeptidase regulatory-like domain-containing protein [Cyanobacteria bacterium SBC]